MNSTPQKYIEIFSTSDLSLATVLSLHAPIEKINKEDPRKALFVFISNSMIADLINQYWKKELLVEPREYSDQMRSLKARLYASK